MKKNAMIAMLCCISFFLSSCTSLKITESPAYPTLPPVASEFSAPLGDAGMIYMSTVTLYLPAKSGTNLLAVSQDLALNHMESRAEAVCRALLAYPGDGNVTPLGGSVALALYGETPVETSGGVCTVNLAPSAAQLEPGDFYKVCLSIAATLCELPEINYVNVLVANQAAAMDITGTLPQGSLTSHPGEDLSSLWEQMDSRKAPLGTNPSLTPLSCPVSLYFPVYGSTGMIPEVKNVTFSGQSPAQLVLGLLTEMSKGPDYLPLAAQIPNILSLITLNPEIVSNKDGTRSVSLYFQKDIENALAGTGCDGISFFSSIAMTILSFVPATAYVRIFEGNSPVVSATSFASGDFPLENGTIYRKDLSDMLTQSITFYLPGTAELLPCQRIFPAEDAHNLRAFIRSLMENPKDGELDAGIRDVYPISFSNSDLIGISVIDNTLLVNFSLRVSDGISMLNAADEQLLCFSIVNTLCSISGFNKICFFFEGNQIDKLSGGVCWSGEFQPALNLVRQNAG